MRSKKRWRAPTPDVYLESRRLPQATAVIAIHDDGNMAGNAKSLATRIGHDTAIELQRLLPALPTEVTVSLSLGNHVIPGLGFGASALDRHTVAFVVEPADQDTTQQTLEKHLRHTLFHECHHLVRGWVKRGGLRQRHFIDGVICEGLASAFERDAAGYASPWCDYPEEAPGWVDELLALPVVANYRHWMFRHPDGRQWIGYKAGTYIADLAMERSGLDAAQLVSTSTEQILELAGLPQPRAGALHPWLRKLKLS